MSRSATEGQTKGISIFLQILLLFVVANVVSVLAVVVAAFYYSLQSTELRAHETTERWLAGLRDDFRANVAERLDGTLKLIVDLPATDDYMRANEVERDLLLDSLAGQFATVTRGDKQFQSISFIDAAGMLRIALVEGRRRRDSTDLTKRPPTRTGTTGPPLLPYDEIADLFSEIRGTPLLLSSGNMEWFMPPRSALVHGPFMRGGGRPVVLAGLAELDMDIGSFGGAVVVEYDLQPFIDRLSRDSLYGVTPFWVLDAQGNVLYRPNGAIADLDPAEISAGRFLRDPLVENDPRGLVGVVDLPIERGRPVLRVIVALPREAYLADFDPMFQFLAVAVGLSALLFLVFAIIASRRLSRPIEELSRIAARIASGSLDTKIEVAGASGEIGVLVDSVEHMTNELRQTIHDRNESLRNLVEQSRQKQALIRQRIEAEASAKAKSDFLAHMSHELRTPLNSILGFTQVIRQQALGPINEPKYLEYLDDISRSGEHLLSLINDILDLSKIEAGQMELREQPVTVRMLFEDSVRMVRSVAPSRRSAVEIRVTDDFPQIRGDERLLRQILINLLSNAIKFTPEDGHIVLSAEHAESGEIVLSVEDTGMGIVEEDLARVLEPFGQSRGSPQQAHGGTGLGLSLSRQLAVLHGGSLVLESEHGKGTTVRVTLPEERTIPLQRHAN